MAAPEKKEAAPAKPAAKAPAAAVKGAYRLKNVGPKCLVPGGAILPGQVVEIHDGSHKTLKALRKNYPQQFEVVGQEPVAAIAPAGEEEKAPPQA